MNRPRYKMYVAYGSNLNLPQMRQRCATAQAVAASVVKDHALLFRGAAASAVATIEPCAGQDVPVLVWAIQPGDEKALDVYEGFPRLYEKKTFHVNVGGNPVPAMGYVMTEGHMAGLPSQRYLDTIAEGYRTAGFDTEVLQQALARSVDTMRAELEPLYGLEGHAEPEPELDEAGDTPPGNFQEMEWW